jgi:pyruvate dehydrogenase E1 component alpha subunit
MKVTFTPDDLISFEDEIVNLFNEKKIRAPIHLDNGNESQLIEVFRDYVDEDDWILGSWRQHYKCLLKGVPPHELKEAILEGHSIGLCFSDYRVISSAIVGGSLPISVGIAMGIKRAGDKNKVVCFVGEMTSESGTFYECLKYSTNHDLPILFVIEDNGKSVCTPTREVWGKEKLTYEPEDYQAGQVRRVSDKVLYFKYTSKYPHAGAGSRIQF